ncbi:hypothetical protein [Dehalogenimonas alkenigignens]|uniref:hypothetical protein n=1 Tax=Dehalogenimonas alkenigignens TaxID=1217799 RepID=UPI001403BF7C|nr:hypothetical protein [Dehalogenimonas alkenigignens]
MAPISEMTEFVCYCHQHTKADIEADLIKHHGRSSIMEKIIYHRKQGLCECDTKHPEKR